MSNADLIAEARENVPRDLSDWANLATRLLAALEAAEAVAGDRDRASAEAFGLWLLDIGHMPDLGRANMKHLAATYRESEGK
jgi:hypothetical protein